MASPAKIAANRANAQKSTGPRTAAGKGRTRYNAFKHGLSVPAWFGPREAARIDELRSEYFWETLEPDQKELATVAAEAQVEIERVRQVKVELVNRSAKRMRSCDDHQLLGGERVALGLAETGKIVVQCDRYEKRALARRNHALQTYQKLHDARTREYNRERLGPSLPKEARTKNRDDVFNEPALRLEPTKLLNAVKERCGPNLPETWYPGACLEWFFEESAIARIQVSASVQGEVGWLWLRGHAWGERIRQTIVFDRTRTGVGGRIWSVRCPQAGKRVRYLYVVPGGREFSSRHALKLSYQSKSLSRYDRHFERAWRLLQGIGAPDEYRYPFHRDRPPPRPKYMRREKFQRVWDDVMDATVSGSLELEDALAPRGMKHRKRGVANRRGSGRSQTMKQGGERDDGNPKTLVRSRPEYQSGCVGQAQEPSIGQVPPALPGQQARTLATQRPTLPAQPPQMPQAQQGRTAQAQENVAMRKSPAPATTIGRAHPLTGSIGESKQDERPPLTIRDPTEG